MESLLERIGQINDGISDAETSIQDAGFELTKLKNEIDELDFSINIEVAMGLLTKIAGFISTIEKKTMPCRSKSIIPIFSDEDKEVVIRTEVEYFDWGFTEIHQIIKQLKEELNDK